MQGSGIDNVLAAMWKGRYYSVRDLANLSCKPEAIIADVLKFLTKYGFVERLGVSEPLFTKSRKISISPEESASVLNMLTAPNILNEQ